MPEAKSFFVVYPAPNNELPDLEVLFDENGEFLSADPLPLPEADDEPFSELTDEEKAEADETAKKTTENWKKPT